jgi:lipopolysaccharide/colanic/teichoic acid biosynthesis glycosyltransferase
MYSIGFDVYSYPENWIFSDKDRQTEPVGRGIGYDSIRESIEFLFVERVPTWKRVLDICGASVLLLLTAPLFLLLSLYIKIVSPGPVFFKQTRIGYKGLPFEFWKFRTMKRDNNQAFHGNHAHNFITSGDVPMEKLDAVDPRIIVGGRIIRKSCMDELPQLWNVLKGDMSLVGPRPCIPYEAKEYLRWHTHRFDVLPGLSGLWQVSGKNKLTFKQMVRLDIAYCYNVSLLNDLIILLLTPFAILKMCIEAAGNRFRKNEPDITIPFVGTPRSAAQ